MAYQLVLSDDGEDDGFPAIGGHHDGLTLRDGYRDDPNLTLDAPLLPPSGDGLEYAQANARAHRSWLLHTQGEWAQSVAEGEAAWRFFSEHGLDRNAAIVRRGIALAEVAAL